MKKLSDYIFQVLADKGVEHIFLVTGGGAMHLNDAICNEKRIKPICNHHEQACAIAAEAYSRLNGKLGVINVTTGPGGINALNGVFGAWTDSIPMLIISGQVKRATCLRFHNLQGKLRQLGDQEVDIISMVEPITKYSAFVSDPNTIKHHLEKAIYLATSGRPGPCWLDIPIDVQASMIDETLLEGFSIPKTDSRHIENILNLSTQVANKIEQAQRPVLFLGNGLRSSNTLQQAIKFAEKYSIPMVTSWSGIDLLEMNHPLFCGRPGTIGDRTGNFIVQNADVVLVLGSRLNIRQVSYNWENFAKNAFKIVIDIDEAELNKPLVKADLPICANLGDFLPVLNSINIAKNPEWEQWVKWGKERLQKYPVVLPKHISVINDQVNPYYFVQQLVQKAPTNSIFACANGAACVIGFQAATIKKGMRMFANSGDASMGYDLPAAIGAAFAAKNNEPVICLAGDGSIQMNIQELETVKYHNLPIKIFIIDNNGYLSIRTTQQSFFKGNFIGESSKSGVSFPNYCKVASAFDIHTETINSMSELYKIDEILKYNGPVVCVVKVDPEQQFEPKLSSKSLPNGTMISSSLEDMYPFLDNEEMNNNLIR